MEFSLNWFLFLVFFYLVGVVIAIPSVRSLNKNEGTCPKFRGYYVFTSWAIVTVSFITFVLFGIIDFLVFRKELIAEVTSKLKTFDFFKFLAKVDQALNGWVNYTK